MNELFQELAGGNNRTLVKNTPVVLNNEDDTIRLYLTEAVKNRGFKCTLVQYVDSGDTKPKWNDPSLIVDSILEVEATRKGVSVLHFNSSDSDPDQRGVIYQPDIKLMTEVFSTLSALELEYCNKD